MERRHGPEVTWEARQGESAQGREKGGSRKSRVRGDAACIAEESRVCKTHGVKEPDHPETRGGECCWRWSAFERTRTGDGKSHSNVLRKEFHLYFIYSFIYWAELINGKLRVAERIPVRPSLSTRRCRWQCRVLGSSSVFVAELPSTNMVEWANYRGKERFQRDRQRIYRTAWFKGKS